MTSPHQSASRDTVISIGRAYLQMVAAARVLLEREPVWTENPLLTLMQALYDRRLQGLLELLPEDMVAEIPGEQGDGGWRAFSSN